MRKSSGSSVFTVGSGESFIYIWTYLRIFVHRVVDDAIAAGQHVTRKSGSDAKRPMTAGGVEGHSRPTLTVLGRVTKTNAFYRRFGEFSDAIYAAQLGGAAFPSRRTLSLA